MSDETNERVVDLLRRLDALAKDERVEVRESQVSALELALKFDEEIATDESRDELISAGEALIASWTPPGG